MLYLRTGANGSFKTALTLWDVRQMQLKENREVLFVKDRFVAKPILTEEFGWKPIEFKDWLKHRNCIILADELHRDLPKVSESSKRPEHIEMLAEHRSYGHDFFLLDQHPLNIDPFVRRLIGPPGYHQHFVRLLGAANAVSVLQFDATDPVCEKPAAVKRAQTSTRNPHKEAYEWYESASLHTGKLRIPKQLWTLLACIVAGIAVVYLLVTRFMPGATGDTKASTSSSTSTTAKPSTFGVTAGPSDERKPMTTSEYVASYQPRIAGLMHTAPAYDKLTEPRRVPVPAACVEMKSVGCKCYTQDATPYPVDLAMCRQLVAQGAFLAFQAEGETKSQSTPSPMARQATQTAFAGPQAPILIDGGSKPSSGATGVAAAAAADQGAQPRVPPGSKWSFQAGG
ncbi:zona occludens toxin [Variovorax sp. W1I1]|uniref:zonular occludens toxin domain-containing protein n=1 Tax=Variovorax sp. W1I1 TaxID=3042309 RepID=UPI00278794B9|nr:zonular occludens toxin domain-containing protein [Variovorax sp. W1I1]MDQ0608900.1 zona occludens toxin [Variovorax sp. W1I1]